MGPVDTLKLLERPGSSMGRGVALAINGRSISNHIVDHAPRWTESRQTRVNLDALGASVTAPGTHEILVCAHCAEAGYWSSADIGLTAVEVRHDDGLLTWRFALADAGPDAPQMVFRFHRAQVEKALARFEETQVGTKTA